MGQSIVSRVYDIQDGDAAVNFVCTWRDGTVDSVLTCRDGEVLVFAGAGPERRLLLVVIAGSNFLSVRDRIITPSQFLPGTTFPAAVDLNP